MHADKDIEAYLTVLRRSPSDRALVTGASLLIAAGFLMVIYAALGIFSALSNNKLLLRLVRPLVVKFFFQQNLTSNGYELIK